MVDSIDHFLGRLNGILIGVFAAIIGLVAVLIPLNLLLVRMHWGALWWLHEAIEYALYLGVFLAAPWVLRKGAHIKADVISAHLPERLAVQLDRLINFIGAGISTILCIYAFRSAMLEYQDYTFPPKDFRIANWYMMAVFSLTFLLCTFEFLLALRRRSGIDDEVDAATPVGM